MMYRAREDIDSASGGDYKIGCQRLPNLLEAFKARNPQSVTVFEVDPANRFRRAFLSHPDAELLQQTRQHVYGVDGAFLKSRGIKNTMMVLVGRNGNNENTVVAVAICPSEDGDNCGWFFDPCCAAGIHFEGVPVFSDRGTGILCATSTRNNVLQHCTRHIIGNVKKEFKGAVTNSIEGAIWELQSQESEEAFKSKLGCLAISNEGIAAKLDGIDHDTWALYPHVFSKKPYGWRTTNFVESENSKALAVRSENPFEFFRSYMERWMKDKYERGNLARRWIEESKSITPYAQKLYHEQDTEARFHEVTPSNSSVVFVRDSRGSPPVQIRVDLEAKTCECSFFFQYGIPCRHIITALAYTQRSDQLFSFFDDCYLCEVYLRANDTEVSNIEIVSGTVPADTNVLPPPKSSKRGRPEEKRKPSAGEAPKGKSSTKHRKCGHCGNHGHN